MYQLCLTSVSTITNQIYIHKQIKDRLNLRNAYYSSDQNLRHTSPQTKNIQIKIYRSTILFVVLYGRETCFFKLREKHRIRVFEKRVMGKILGCRRDEVTGDWRVVHNEET